MLILRRATLLPGQLLFGQWALDLGWRAHHQALCRTFETRLDECRGRDDAARRHMGTIHHHRVHADQGVFAHAAAVQHGAMPDMQAFCKIGLVPDSGGTWLLPRQVGMARAKALAMLGERLGAEQAQQWGLIHRVVDDAALRDEALALARQLATQPTYGLALIKRSLNASFDNGFDEQLELERDLQRLAGRSEDYREGVSAFMNKRTPAFKGR